MDEFYFEESNSGEDIYDCHYTYSPPQNNVIVVKLMRKCIKNGLKVRLFSKDMKQLIIHKVV
jgi:hypothetical protein